MLDEEGVECIMKGGACEGWATASWWSGCSFAVRSAGTTRESASSTAVNLFERAEHQRGELKVTSTTTLMPF